MSLIFTGLTIPGITLDMRVAPPESHTVRTHYPGLKGTSEVRLGFGGRPIQFDFILTDPSFRKARDVQNLLAKFDEKVQEHGTLHVLDADDGTVRRFLNVTFEGCVPTYQPIRDDAKTMQPNVATYHCGVQLSFWQLTTKDD
jgi:hypothetical protein